MTEFGRSWLDRIGLGSWIPAPPVPSPQVLLEVCDAQMRCLPFENFDVFLTGQISLEPARLAAKLLAGRRGGWCFELNAVLALGLGELGFPIRNLMGRNISQPGEAKPRTHQVLLVGTSGGPWLADCGFGGLGLRRALPLVDGFQADQVGARLRLSLVPTPPDGLEASPAWVVAMASDGAWEDLYRFTLEPWEPLDFAMACHFHTSSALSSFTRSRMASIAHADGRSTLSDRRWRRYLATGNQESLAQEAELDSPSRLREVLADVFGIRLEPGQADVLYDLKPAPALSPATPRP